MSSKKILAGCCLALLPAWVQAQDSSLAAGVTAGTMGLGLTATTRVSEHVNIRAIVAGISVDTSGETDEVDYDADADLLFAGGMVDLHPAGGGFRLSLGLFYNGSDIRASGRCTRTDCQLGSGLGLIGNGDRIEGDIDFNSAAPYLGLGWGNAVDATRRWRFSFDLGAMYIGEGEASLRCAQVNTVNQAACTAGIQEEERQLQEDLADFRIYPVVMLGAVFRF